MAIIHFFIKRWQNQIFGFTAQQSIYNNMKQIKAANLTWEEIQVENIMFWSNSQSIIQIVLIIFVET